MNDEADIVEDDSDTPVEAAPKKGPPKGRVANFLAGELVKKIKKTHGETALLRATDMKVLDTPRIPTGIFSLDYALGGGFPVGRISTLYGEKSAGKTTLFLKAIANAQNMCSECYTEWDSEKESCECGSFREMVCAYLDVEGALDLHWAKKLGVDTENLIVDVPEYAEQALDIGEALIRSGEVDVLVLDSIAFLVPQKEIENSVTKDGMGIAPRLVGKGVRKFVSAINGVGKDTGRRPTVFFTNQIRYKLGVMFGNPECLHGDTPIPFADGSSHTIKDVVENQLKGPVWAFSEEKGFYPAEVSAHYHNGTAKDGEFLTVTSVCPNTRNGVASATVSYTHNFLTDSGWKKAESLSTEDKLVVKVEDRVNGTLASLLRGIFCGDCTVERHKLSASMRFQDLNNEDYIRWKVGLLSPFWTFKEVRTKANNHLRLISNQTYDLLKASEAFSGRNPIPMLEEFSWLSFAIWMMDDACYNKDHNRYSLCVGRYKDDQLMKDGISAALTKVGLGAHSWSGKNIVFEVNLTNVIAKNIAKYVPACMRYKLPVEVEKEIPYEDLEISSTKEYRKFYATITEIGPASPCKYRKRDYYDISVPDGQNYLAGNIANGFVVHNTTSGGQAPGFAASVECRVASGNYEVDDETQKPFAATFRFKINKNKTFSAKMAGEYQMLLVPKGAKRVGDAEDENDLVKWGELTQLITRKNGYNCLGRNFRVKKELMDALQEEPEFKKKLEKALMPKLLDL